jgi:hypothetical protein
MDVSDNTSHQTTLIYPLRTDISYNQYTNVLLIDNTTPSYQTFVDSANVDTFPIVYSKDCFGTELLDVLRNKFTSITRIGFVFISPGNQSSTFLDNMPLFHTDNYTFSYDGLPSKDNGLVAEPYSNKNVELVLTMIREFSVVNIDFLACDTLNYSNWKNYYDLLTQSTGVIVGASDNKTGNIKYGGDWILESTSQDIETVYFTQSIEYYSYLLDTSIYTSTYNYTFTSIYYNNYIYYSGIFGGYIARFNVTTLTGEDTWVVLGHTNQVRALAIDPINNCLYAVGNHSTQILQKVDLTTKSFTSNFISGGYSLTSHIISGISYYSGNLYISDQTDKRIYRVNTTNGNTTIFINALTNPPKQSFVYNGNLYVSDHDSNTLNRYNLSNPSDSTIPLVFKNNISTGFPLKLYYDNTAGSYAINDVTGDVYGWFVNSGSDYIGKINLNTLDCCFNWYLFNPSIGDHFAMTIGGQYLYVTAFNGNNIFKVNTIQPTAPNPTIVYDKGNTFTVGFGNLQVSFTDASNSTNNPYYQYSITGFNGNVFANASVFSSGTNAFRYYITGLSALTDISYSLNMIAKNSFGNSTIQSTSVIIQTTPTAITNSTISSSSIGNINVSVTETTPSTYYYLNNVSYWYYLYTTGTNQSSNIAAYSQGATMNASYTTNFVIQNLPSNAYRVYLIAKNSVGNTISNAFSANVSVYTIPSPNLYIDAGNTRTVASGNLQVRIIDLSNELINNVYYYYALNNNVDASFANTFVRANVSPYTFWIPSITDISNTLYVRAQNPLGNSFPAANLQVTVYQTPRAPPQVSFTSVGSGNVQVSINELASQPVPYYYLNNVSYYLYAYNNATGTNLSGNTSLLVYNIPVGILSNTNTTYGNIVSYVNTGLNANTYTMYVIARNTVGNSNPISANIAVLFTPSAPSIDAVNTISLSSGNLTISINDTVNTNNQVYYLYSLDGINYGNSRAFRGGNTRTVFTVSDTGNAQIPLTAITYTLYIKASNSIGNSTPTTAPVIVYTTPQSPTIDVSNTQSLTSGNLTVYVNDTVNSLTNGIYYLYSMDGITYGNSGVPKTGNTANFTISNTGNAQVPLTSKTYTLYIAASNPVGNSISNPATEIESVYTIPSPPTIDQTNTKSLTSGNLNVAFTDTFNNGNNQVEYTYFMYDSTAAPLFFV